MRVKIACAKCRSNNVAIISDEKDSTPMYKCNQCGYRHSLFLKLGNAEKTGEEIEEETQEKEEIIEEEDEMDEFEEED